MRKNKKLSALAKIKHESLVTDNNNYPLKKIEIQMYETNMASRRSALTNERAHSAQQ